MKNKKALTLLFISNGISGFAQGISMLSIPWYFTQQNQSSLFIAFFAAVTLGSLFWGLYAGALVDGFNRKDVFLGTNFIEGLIILSVASLGFKEGILPGALIMLVFTITFFGYHIHYPNLYAFAQEITDPKDYTKVTSYIEIVGQSTSIGAAALGALLLEGVDTVQTIPFLNLEIPIHIAKWELHEIFLMDGLTYIASFIMILFIKHKPSRDITHLEEGDLKEKLKSGYDYLVSNKLVLLFGMCSYSIFIVTLVEIFSLRPLYISHHLQEGGDILGLSELLYAAGSLVSGIIINTLLSRMPIPRSIVILTFLTAIAFFVCSFTQNVFVFLGISMVTGFTNAGSRIFRVSYLFNLIPNELTGRVNSMFNVISTFFRMFFIITFIFPFFSKGSNVVYAYLILGIFTMIAGFVLIFLYKRILRLTERISEVGTLSH